MSFERTAVIQNESGIHARVAAGIVQRAAADAMTAFLEGDLEAMMKAGAFREGAEVRARG